jgi:hypothetical protein
MLKFLFRGRETNAVVETQRQRFERIVTELNDAIDGLPVKPRVTLDPVTGHFELHLPEQLPDEALALPAPTQEAVEKDVGAVETETPDAVTEAVQSKVA